MAPEVFNDHGRLSAIEQSIAKHDAQIGQLTGTVDRLANSLDKWTGQVDAKMDSIDSKLSGVGQVSARTVFNGTIAAIGALNIVFVAAVSLGVVYVGLRSDPIVTGLAEEVSDRKTTDRVVTEQGERIAEMRAQLAGMESAFARDVKWLTWLAMEAHREAKK